MLLGIGGGSNAKSNPISSPTSVSLFTHFKLLLIHLLLVSTMTASAATILSPQSPSITNYSGGGIRSGAADRRQQASLVAASGSGGGDSSRPSKPSLLLVLVRPQVTATASLSDEKESDANGRSYTMIDAAGAAILSGDEVVEVPRLRSGDDGDSFRLPQQRQWGDPLASVDGRRIASSSAFGFPRHISADGQDDGFFRRSSAILKRCVVFPHI